MIKKDNILESLEKAIFKNILIKNIEENIVEEVSPVDEEKCSKPKYISNLPGDLRSNDINVLQNRLDKIDEELKKRENDFNTLEKEYTSQEDKLIVTTNDMGNESEDLLNNITRLGQAYGEFGKDGLDDIGDNDIIKYHQRAFNDTRNPKPFKELIDNIKDLNKNVLNEKARRDIDKNLDLINDVIRNLSIVSADAEKEYSNKIIERVDDLIGEGNIDTLNGLLVEFDKGVNNLNKITDTMTSNRKETVELEKEKKDTKKRISEIS